VLALVLRGFRLVPAEARASVLEDAIHARSLSVCIYSVNTVYRMRGRPPLRPFLRAAATLAADDFRPPTRPSSASHSGPANTEETRPGTLRSTSRLWKCKPPPRPRISTARISSGVARSRFGINFTGNVIAAPFVSSISSACRFGRYTAATALGSVFAARFPARDARAKFERSSFATQPGIRCDLRMGTKRLGYPARQKCPKFTRSRLKELP